MEREKIYLKVHFVTQYANLVSTGTSSRLSKLIAAHNLTFLWRAVIFPSSPHLIIINHATFNANYCVELASIDLQFATIEKES